MRKDDCIGLILIDVQMGFKDPAWGHRSAGDELEATIADLLASWRRSNQPVVHVYHNSLSPDGQFKPGTKGNEPMPEAAPVEEN